jgi:hypothetical protein
MRQSFAQPTASSASRSVNPGYHGQTKRQPARTRQPQDDLSIRTASISAERQASTRRHSVLEPRPKEYYRLLTEPRSPVYLAGKSACGSILMVEHAYRASKPTGGRPPQIKVDTCEQPQTPDSSTATEPAEHQPRRDVVFSESESAPLPRREPPKGVSVQAVKNMFESKASQSQADNPPPPPRAELGIKRGMRVKEQVEKLQPSTLSRRQSKDSATSERAYSSASVRIPQEVDSMPPLSQPSPTSNPAKQDQSAQRTHNSVQPAIKGWKRDVNAPRIGRLDVDRSRRASRTTDDVCDTPTVSQNSTRPGRRRNSE